MRAPISIVMPVLNAAELLPATLDSLLEGVGSGVIRELVISDGGSGDDTKLLAREAGAVVVEGPPGRGGQLRRGAELARGEWLFFLHADTHLPPGWVAPVMAHIAGGEGQAAVFRLAFRADGVWPRLVAGWANLRSRSFGLPYGDQGLLISRALYDEIGGFPDQPLMEDVAIARALRGRLVMLEEAVLTDAGRYQRGGWLRRGARNLWTLARYLMGADPARLARSYHKS